MNPHLLRAAVHNGHEHLLGRADATADVVDQVVGKAWGRLLDYIKMASRPERRHDWMTAYNAAAATLRAVGYAVAQATANRLLIVAQASHQAATNAILSKLPRPALEAVLAKRFNPYHSPRLALEAEGDDPLTFDQLMQQMIFPMPSQFQIDQVVFAGDWVSRIQALTKLAPPEMIAAQVANALQQGKTYLEIAKLILPLVNGIRSSARRVARTEGVRVGHEFQMQAWEQMGELVIGYQVHWTPNHNTRWWHKSRDGTQYFKNPEPGQKGYYQMPRPPMEAADPAERPPRTPQVAANCLCWNSPILKS